MLPSGLTCSQCVLQWRYIAGNNWGMCPNGTGAVGCGPQEEFRSCADVSITDTAGTADGTPFEEATTQKGKEKEEKEKETTKEKEQETTPNIEENEIPDDARDKLHHPEATKAKTGQYVVFLVSIMGCSLLVIVTIFILLYFYYYHANEIIQNWWKKGGSGLRDATCWSAIKKSIQSCSKRGQEKPDQKSCLGDQKGPVPPPRTKKHSIGFKGVPENLV